jgi:uncharacterized protein (UPF0335 family)
MTNNKVASYAERIERLLDERATIDADIKDIYTEVKSADLKPKVLRKAIANKRRKTDAQFEAEVEEYAALLLALPGATYRGVAEQTGIPKSTLQRRVPRKANGTTTPHDPETGEVHGAEHSTAEAGRADDSGDQGHHPAIGVVGAADGIDHASGEKATQAVPDRGAEVGVPAVRVPLSNGPTVEQGAPNSLRDGGAPVETSTVGPAVTTPDDDLAIPSFLRRVRT